MILLQNQYANESMLDIYFFETTQNIEQLEMCILENEKANGYKHEIINEIFRIMHTIYSGNQRQVLRRIS